MKSFGYLAFLPCLLGVRIAVNKGRALEVMKTRIETLYAPVEDYFHESNGVPHGCRPVVHIPDEPPRCLVTLLHGFTSCPDEFGHFLPDLVAEGCLVVVPALPGHGFRQGGGRPNIPGFRRAANSSAGTRRQKVPEPERYFQFVFDVARILSDAGLSGIPNKMVGGSSLGGSSAAMLALCSDVKWDRVLIMNAAFQLPPAQGLVAFNMLYRSRLSWNSVAIWDRAFLNIHTCDGEDRVTAPGYCDFYASSMVSLFQFSHVVMGFWEAVPLFRQGLEDKAVEKLQEMMGHVLKMGGEGGSMRAWDGQRWRFTRRADGQESSWEAREREQPGRQAILAEMLRQGARHIAESESVNIQVVGCGEHGDDGAVSKEGLQKFIQLAGSGGHEAQTHFCAFPGGGNGMPHPWTRPYINPNQIFWWNPYSRVVVSRFALHGEPFRRTDAGSHAGNASDVCFVDAIADGDARHAPFLGREYTARYPLFEPSALLEHWKEFSFTGLECTPGLACDTHVWKMGRASRHRFWRRAACESFTLQPLLSRFVNSSRPSEEPHHTVPIVAERDEPADWSQALQQPIRAAWVKAPGGCYDEPFPTECSLLTEGSEDGACLMVPLRRLMPDGDSGGLARSLVGGALYEAPEGAEESTLQFCGKGSEVAVLRGHVC